MPCDKKGFAEKLNDVSEVLTPEIIELVIGAKDVLSDATTAKNTAVEKANEASSSASASESAKEEVLKKLQNLTAIGSIILVDSRVDENGHLLLKIEDNTNVTGGHINNDGHLILELGA